MEINFNPPIININKDNKNMAISIIILAINFMVSLNLSKNKVKAICPLTPNE